MWSQPGAHEAGNLACTKALTQLGRSPLSRRRKVLLCLENPLSLQGTVSQTQQRSPLQAMNGPSKDKEATLSVSGWILGPSLSATHFQGDRITQLLDFASELATDQDPRG